MTEVEPPIVERGLLAMSNAAWEHALRRTAAIALLAAVDLVGQVMADNVAALMVVSHHQVYVLIDRYVSVPSDCELKNKRTTFAEGRLRPTRQLELRQP